MKRPLTLLLVAAAVAGSGCAVLETALPEATAAGDPARQILVMIESPVPHYQPGVAVSGYAAHAVRIRTTAIAGALARDHGAVLVQGWAMRSLALHCFVMEAAPDDTPGALAVRIGADPRVESVQPLHFFRTAGRPAPRVAYRSDAELDLLHRVATGRDVRIAQADTGADLRHPQLAGRLYAARNFVDGGAYSAEVHGTAVAGVIVARAGAGLGTTGVAPDARLMPLRACWEDPAHPDAALCTSYTLARAIQFALDRRVQVLNLSLTGPYDRLLERLIDRGAERGITVVGAVDPAAPDGGFPASHPRVVAVAVEDDSRLPSHAILAPGRDVLTTVPAGGWGLFSGPSFAAAHVTGIAALLIEARPSLTGEEIRTVLMRHGRHAPAGGGARLDACAALASVARFAGCPP
jgi:hypothetical protein